MKLVLLTAACLLSLTVSTAHAESQIFTAGGYQEADGAITVQQHGDLVDPYFAARSLLIAHREGLPVRESALAWITWMLPRQEANGLFQRFCRQGGAWVACAPADADDALLALWIELLHAMAPRNGMPKAWSMSIFRARLQLDQLLDRQRGIYLISASQPVGLFMDNVEILAALNDTAHEQQRMGALGAAHASLQQAQRLQRRIEAVFHPQGTGPYLISTQRGNDTNFYPDIVAQIYPVLFHMPIPGVSPRKAMQMWLDAHEQDWLSLTQDTYPWGLVALAAAQTGRCDVALRWFTVAAPLRHGPRWNVLEETAFSLIGAWQAKQLPTPTACTERSM